MRMNLGYSERKISVDRLPGRKNEKKHIKFLEIRNETGTERFHVVMIRKSRNPRCLKDKLGSEILFYYRNNIKAWMTGDLFTEWMSTFSELFWGETRAQSYSHYRQFEHHGTVESLDVYRNVKLLFLPLNRI